jgi:uncharacterized protein YcbK (DUF882 family)
MPSYADLLYLKDGYYYWPKYSCIKLSKSFTTDEFSCPCSNVSCNEQRLSFDLFDRLTKVREDFGTPLRVTSGYRCHEYQMELRARGYETAAGVSQHEMGNACDIQPTRQGMIGLLEHMVVKYFKAVGIAQSFIHIDTRADKERRWGYTQRK